MSKTSSPNWRLGLVLTIGVVTFWGTQTVAMGIIVKQIPATSVAFYKISSATLVLMLSLIVSNRLPSLRDLPTRTLATIALGSSVLAVSYYFFANAFLYTTPGNIQLFIQSERIILALCGLYFFGERFLRLQWIGLAILPIGFYLFFYDQLSYPESTWNYAIGVGMVILAAATWSTYALCQKALSFSLRADQALASIFLGATICLTPFLEFESLIGLDWFYWLVLAYICLSNFGAFRCFSGAVEHWPISRIGALTSLTPLVTLATSYIVSSIAPDILTPEQASVSGVTGTLLVVLGSALIVQRTSNQS